VLLDPPVELLEPVVMQTEHRKLDGGDCRKPLGAAGRRECRMRPASDVRRSTAGGISDKRRLPKWNSKHASAHAPASRTCGSSGQQGARNFYIPRSRAKPGRPLKAG
jgi:hypothetical protein